MKQVCTPKELRAKFLAYAEGLEALMPRLSSGKGEVAVEAETWRKASDEVGRWEVLPDAARELSSLGQVMWAVEAGDDTKKFPDELYARQYQDALEAQGKGSQIYKFSVILQREPVRWKGPKA